VRIARVPTPVIAFGWDPKRKPGEEGVVAIWTSGAAGEGPSANPL